MPSLAARSQKGGKIGGKALGKGKGVLALDEEQGAAGHERIGDIKAVDWDIAWNTTGRERVFGNLLKDIGNVDRVIGKKGHEINEVRHGWKRVRVQVDSGAVDTVGQMHVAQGFELTETAAFRQNVSFGVANGTRIENCGERKIASYTEGGDGISMRMTCAHVQKV